MSKGDEDRIKMMSLKSNPFVSFLLRFGLSAGLLFWIFRKIDWQKTIAALKSADIHFLILAFVIFVGTNLIILWRWIIFIRALGLHLPVISIARWFFIGLFCNLFLPSAIGGDVIKCLGLCGETTYKAKAFASIVLDRLSGFAGIVVVSTIAFIFGYGLINDMSLIASIMSLAGVSIVIAFMLFHTGFFKFCCRIFHFWPALREKLMHVHYDILLLRDKKLQGIGAIGLSAVAQMILAVVFYFTARALHQDVSLVYFLIFSPLVCVATSLPSIGGLGVREVGWVYLLSKVGVDEGIAASISLINFFFMVLIGLLGGVIYVLTLSSRRLQHHPQDACAPVQKP